jgi:hypothetical protein
LDKDGKTRKEGRSLYFEGNMMVLYSETRRMVALTFVCTFFSHALCRSKANAPTYKCEFEPSFSTRRGQVLSAAGRIKIDGKRFHHTFVRVSATSNRKYFR